MLPGRAKHNILTRINLCQRETMMHIQEKKTPKRSSFDFIHSQTQEAFFIPTQVGSIKFEQYHDWLRCPRALIVELNLWKTKCYYINEYLRRLSVAPNSHHMAHKAVISYRDASKWSKMGRGRKLAMVRLPPFEVSLILKLVGVCVCVCVCVCALVLLFLWEPNWVLDLERFFIYPRAVCESKDQCCDILCFSYYQQISWKDKKTMHIFQSVALSPKPIGSCQRCTSVFFKEFRNPLKQLGAVVYLSKSCSNRSKYRICCRLFSAVDQYTFGAVSICSSRTMYVGSTQNKLLCPCSWYWGQMSFSSTVSLNDVLLNCFWATMELYGTEQYA